jgi:hypothetical protein
MDGVGGILPMVGTVVGAKFLVPEHADCCEEYSEVWQHMLNTLQKSLLSG